jgi:hypothetical protein
MKRSTAFKPLYRAEFFEANPTFAKATKGSTCLDAQFKNLGFLAK